MALQLPNARYIEIQTPQGPRFLVNETGGRELREVDKNYILGLAGDGARNFATKQGFNTGDLWQDFYNAEKSRGAIAQWTPEMAQRIGSGEDFIMGNIGMNLSPQARQLLGGNYNVSVPQGQDLASYLQGTGQTFNPQTGFSGGVDARTGTVIPSTLQTQQGQATGTINSYGQPTGTQFLDAQNVINAQNQPTPVPQHLIDAASSVTPYSQLTPEAQYYRSYGKIMPPGATPPPAANSPSPVTPPAGSAGSLSSIAPSLPSLQGSSSQGSQGGQGGGLNFPSTPTFQPFQAPTKPSNLSQLESQYSSFIQPSADEVQTQQLLNNLIASRELGIEQVRQQPIALPFITGQSAAIQRQAAIQAIPLEQKLALAQAQRQSALEASKFALDRADRDYDRELSLSERQSEQSNTFNQQNFQNLVSLYQLQTGNIAEANRLAQQQFENQQRQYEFNTQQNEPKTFTSGNSIIERQQDGSYRVAFSGGSSSGQGGGSVFGGNTNTGDQNDKIFTDNQLNKGAITAGIPINDFRTLDNDSKNFFINNSKVINDVKKEIDAAKETGSDPRDIEREISESNVPDSAKDTLTRYLKEVFRNEYAQINSPVIQERKSIIDKIFGWF